ncbi:MAG: hypothetical protein HC824_17050, partial [Synechococcales cyanobacterium RM1_1_8]|nr:hypothetical protein [Synechococcales cyanobacterium RM1_1_8]
LVQYASNRALWADEAVLALNLVNRSWGELAGPLDYDQGAPLLYLWATKLAIVLWGNQELALRLVPLLGSLVGLGLFYQLARQFLGPWRSTLALVWFGSLRYLLYYATELKQYSTDVTLAIACFCWCCAWVGARTWVGAGGLGVLGGSDRPVGLPSGGVCADGGGGDGGPAPGAGGAGGGLAAESG